MWLMDSLSGSYLDKTLPLETIRALSGFPSKKKGRLFWPRNSLLPPDSLQKKIFPWIENGEKQVIEMIRIEKTEFSGTGFLKLMKYLRVVILQDAVVYLKTPAFMNNPVFKDPLFSSDEFNTFRNQLETFLQEGNIPKSAMLDRVSLDVYC